MRSLLVIVAGALLVALPVASRGADPGRPLPTVAIDVSALDRPIFEHLESAGIYQGVVLRLVNEKVAIVSPRERADLVLRFLPGARDGELRIVAGDGALSRERVLALGRPARLDEDAVQLEVIHAAVEVVRQLQSSMAARPRPAEPVQRSRAELTSGVLGTGGSSGLLGRLAVARRAAPVELGAALAVHQPLGLPSALSVTEWGAFAGVGTGERPLGTRVRWAAGLDAGVWQHRWRYAAAGSSDSGARLDLAALLHVGAGWRLSPRWRAGGTLGTLWTSRGHAHRDAAGTLWQTSAVRPLAGLTLAFGGGEESR